MTHQERSYWWTHALSHYNRVFWAIENNEPGIAACAAIRLCRTMAQCSPWVFN